MGAQGLEVRFPACCRAWRAGQGAEARRCQRFDGSELTGTRIGTWLASSRLPSSLPWLSLPPTPTPPKIKQEKADYFYRRQLMPFSFPVSLQLPPLPFPWGTFSHHCLSCRKQRPGPNWAESRGKAGQAYSWDIHPPRDPRPWSPPCPASSLRRPRASERSLANSPRPQPTSPGAEAAAEASACLLPITTAIGSLRRASPPIVDAPAPTSRASRERERAGSARDGRGGLGRPRRGARSEARLLAPR